MGHISVHHARNGTSNAVSNNSFQGIYSVLVTGSHIHYQKYTSRGYINLTEAEFVRATGYIVNAQAELIHRCQAEGRLEHMFKSLVLFITTPIPELLKNFGKWVKKKFHSAQCEHDLKSAAKVEKKRKKELGPLAIQLEIWIDQSKEVLQDEGFDDDILGLEKLRVAVVNELKAT